jgi:hypothetical protein
LLIWNIGDGWEPICGALGLPAPAEPFPHEHDSRVPRDERPRRVRVSRAGRRQVLKERFGRKVPAQGTRTILPRVWRSPSSA